MNIINLKDFNIDEEVLKKYEFEFGRKFFGETLFTEPKSTKEVYYDIKKNAYELELFKKIISIKRLTKEAEWALTEEILVAIQSGNEVPDAIKNTLILNALPAVSALAFKYLQRYNTIYNYADFICEGYLALNSSFDKWLRKSPTEKAKNILDGETVFASFGTYSYSSVKDAFAVMISKDTALSSSLSTQKKIKKISAYKAEFIKKYGKVPTEKELSIFSGYTEGEIKGASFFLTRIQTEDVDDIKMQDFYKDIVANDINEINDNKLQKLHNDILHTFLKNTLTELQYEVIKMWYFENKTFVEISKILGVSLTKATSLRNLALAKLQSNSLELKKMLETK